MTMLFTADTLLGGVQPERVLCASSVAVITVLHMAASGLTLSPMAGPESCVVCHL